MDAFSVLNSRRGTAGARELAVRDSNRWTATRHWLNSPLPPACSGEPAASVVAAHERELRPGLEGSLPRREELERLGEPTSTSSREAGTNDAPAILLLHGFPTSSQMFRNLIPLLADEYGMVAPDYPGFGHSSMPPRDQFSYTFDNLAKVIDEFTEKVGLSNYALYVQGYGAYVANNVERTGTSRGANDF